MNKFDKNIKDKLEGYASPVNSDMWSKISAGLPVQEQTSPRYWIWAMIGFGIVSLGTLSYYLFQSDISREAEHNTIAAINERANLDLDVNTAITNQASLVNSNQSGITNSDKVNTAEIDDVVVNESHERKVDESLNFIDTKSKKSDTAYKRDQSVIINNQVVSANDLQVYIQKLDDEREVIDLNASIKDKEVASLYKQYNTIFNKAQQLNYQSEENKDRLEVQDVTPLGYTLPQLRIDNNFDELLQSMSGKRLLCPSFSNARFGIFVEGFYSSDLGLRALSYNGPVSEGDYLNVRNETEKANYSYSTGLRLSFLLPNGIGAKTGISYGQINETFKYEDPNSKQTKTVIIKEYIWENGIVTDSSEVTKEIDVPGALNVVNQNKYRVIDIPLLFTYEWGYKKRMYYSVTAGPMFNLRFTQRGKFLNPETLTPIDFSTDNGEYKAFNTNVGTSIYLSFALNYQLGNDTDIFVEPNMRHFLNTATLNSYLLNQKYTVVGVGFGIKHKI